MPTIPDTRLAQHQQEYLKSDKYFLENTHNNMSGQAMGQAHHQIDLEAGSNNNKIKKKSSGLSKLFKNFSKKKKSSGFRG